MVFVSTHTQTCIHPPGGGALYAPARTTQRVSRFYQIYPGYLIKYYCTEKSYLTLYVPFLRPRLHPGGDEPQFDRFFCTLYDREFWSHVVLVGKSRARGQGKTDREFRETKITK